MIVVKKLRKRFGSHLVLDDLDLVVEEGETLVILGRSGVGKSVLLKHLIGLMQPDSGSVEIHGVRISELRDAALYEAIREMGMLFQGSALFDSMTVRENVGFYLREHHKGEDRIEERVAEALHMVGMDETEQLMPSDLSGGMKKRVALARLIAYSPKILLYDEPTTGLDPITAMQINDLILSTQKQLNATSVVVTHDLCSAFHVADRIAFHHEGKIIYIVRKEEFAQIEDPVVKSFLRNAVPKII